jgi:ABC-type lipoprotein export system ATPase subunit
MPTPALEVRNLAFAYAGSPWTLRVPSLTLAPREQLLMQATSGSGKSTLLSLIAGLLDPAQGTISVQGTTIHALSGPARDRFRGRTLGMVFQSHHLISGLSALENVLAAPLMASLPVSAARAQELLAQLGIVRVSAKIDDLSVGQQQRVAIARALVCNPALVLADEPTASLDPANAEAAMDLLQQTCHAANAALLCVSHDPAMARRFSRVEPLLTADAAAQPLAGSTP